MLPGLGLVHSRGRAGRRRNMRHLAQETDWDRRLKRVWRRRTAGRAAENPAQSRQGPGPSSGSAQGQLPKHRAVARVGHGQL